MTRLNWRPVGQQGQQQRVGWHQRSSGGSCGGGSGSGAGSRQVPAIAAPPRHSEHPTCDLLPRREARYRTPQQEPAAVPAPAGWERQATWRGTQTYTYLPGRCIDSGSRSRARQGAVGMAARAGGLPLALCWPCDAWQEPHNATPSGTPVCAAASSRLPGVLCCGT